MKPTSYFHELVLYTLKRLSAEYSVSANSFYFVLVNQNCNISA